MKSLLLGIVFILFVGIGGFMYRNAVEYPARSSACPLDAMVCPDGTSVARSGVSCTFPACAPPNVSLSDSGIAYAVPDGFIPTELPDSASVAAYRMPGPTPTEPSDIIIRRFIIATTSDSSGQGGSPQAVALAVIEQTAIGSPSGLPVNVALFTSIVLGDNRFTVVPIERFEAVINTAYYLTRGADILRFDAIDRGAVNWMDPNLDVSTLPAHAALTKLLATLQGG
ncbi:MAG: hypothetical protein HY461_01760 [Parcubacteria group bacterium]|nr:hypothetical protein [Parcubacteria group bacterium]